MKLIEFRREGIYCKKGDLLVANNNVTIPDDTGFNQPKKVING